MEFRGVSVRSLGSTLCGTTPIEPSIERLTRPQPRSGESFPRVIHEVKPTYTIDAMRRKAQGAVLLEAVVLPDGTVGSVCVVRSLDLDLDLQAIAATRSWRFTPGTRDGVAVAVVVTVEMQFTLE